MLADLRELASLIQVGRIPLGLRREQEDVHGEVWRRVIGAERGVVHGPQRPADPTEVEHVDEVLPVAARDPSSPQFGSAGDEVLLPALDQPGCEIEDPMRRGRDPISCLRAVVRELDRHPPPIGGDAGPHRDAVGDETIDEVRGATSHQADEAGELTRTLWAVEVELDERDDLGVGMEVGTGRRIDRLVRHVGQLEHPGQHAPALGDVARRLGDRRRWADLAPG